MYSIEYKYVYYRGKKIIKCPYNSYLRKTINVINYKNIKLLFILWKIYFIKWPYTMKPFFKYFS